MVVVIAENIAQTEMRGESYHLIDMEEENKVQGREEGKKDMVTGPRTGRSILQMKTEGTLATGEEDARGPKVTEGPSQATPGPGHPLVIIIIIVKSVNKASHPPLGKYQRGGNPGG